MLSQFRQKKIQKLFWFWDADKNGYLEKKDYMSVGEKLSAERNWAVGSPENEFLMKKLLEDWLEAEKFADTDKDNRISLSEWLVFCDVFTTDAEMYKVTVTNVAQAIVDACDIDVNGILERHEWQLLFRIYGKTNAEADESFDIITNGGKDKLTQERILTLLDSFFYEENEDAIGNYFFGKL